MQYYLSMMIAADDATGELDSQRVAEIGCTGWDYLWNLTVGREATNRFRQDIQRVYVNSRHPLPPSLLVFGMFAKKNLYPYV